MVFTRDVHLAIAFTLHLSFWFTWVSSTHYPEFRL